MRNLKYNNCSCKIRKALKQRKQFITLTGQDIYVEIDEFCQNRAGNLANAISGIVCNRTILYPVDDTGQMISHRVPVIGNCCKGQDNA